MEAGMSGEQDGRRDMVTSWAEESVWSFVCLTELGLISKPCWKSKSFDGLADDGSLVRTSTPTPKEFPSINSTIDAAAGTRRTDLGFPNQTKILPRSRKKPSLRRLSSNGKGRRRKNTTKKKLASTSTVPCKSTTAERNVCWELDPELDHARITTVEQFWKSCKRKVNGDPRKRPDENCHDPDRSLGTAANDHFPTSDQPRSVDLVPGICYQAERPGDSDTDFNVDGTTVPGSNGPQQTLNPEVGHQLHRRKPAKLVPKRTDLRRGRRKKTKLEIPDTDVINVETSPTSIFYHESAGSSRNIKEEEDDSQKDGQEEHWENETVDSPPVEDVHLQDSMSNSQVPEASSTLFESGIGTSEADFDSPESFPDQEQEPKPEPMGLPEDMDAVQLSERIPVTGNKCPTTDDEENCYGSRGNSVQTSGSSGFSDSYSVGPVSSDVQTTNDHGEPRKTKRRKSNKGNDYRCKSADSVLVAQPPKRSKITRSNGVVATSLKNPALKADTLRAKASRNDEEYHETKRVTRGSAKISKENFVGKLIWGCCSGWWPALIIDADHAGMLSEAGKLWVYWIGEARISLLNERTQIEPFSCNVMHRLEHPANVARMRAIDATMQMLRRYLGSTLTKPYWRWIANNFSETTVSVDEVMFYPFPPKIEQRLAHLKSTNAKTTEKFLMGQKRSHPTSGPFPTAINPLVCPTGESQPKKTAEKPKESPQQSNTDLTRLPLREQNPGVITWAKIAGHNWWPAMIIDYRDCCMREPSFGCQWIMWYGDYKLSEIHHQCFMRFEMGLEKMRDYVNKTKKHLFLVGVLQASKDYCSRMGYETDNWTMEDVFKYFSKMNRPQPQPNPLRSPESVRIYDKYSTRIVKMLNELKNDPNVDDKRADDIQNSDDLRSVTSGQASLESLCLKCLKIYRRPMQSHPFFEGSLCDPCSEQYKPCMFVFGNDGKCFYCTICAATGTVIICDNEDCPRVYCTACMKHLLCPATYEQVLLEDPWECFLCKVRSGSVPDIVARPRSNWKDKIIDMFRTSCNSSTTVANKHTDNKRRIRVLSLFDGLSTGMLVLHKLGLEVDAYYASEIDPDALMVSAMHYGNHIVQLGDVRNITKEMIKEMVPIDLLIGGSPCNDLSLVNPARLGLHDPRGTGILFFEYWRLLKLVKKLNSGRHLFWLYENVASMPSVYRLEINKYLGQEPDVIDSADFSPQHRLRLYWHNLPFERYSLPFQGDTDVQDILTPHCQRYALVKKIRTVTTKVNSLKQGKTALKPILMKDQSDSLWITELEEIFGFPRHYTDVKNLSATKRQRLIGKSWSVQTLTAIFKSLCPYFVCSTIPRGSTPGLPKSPFD